MKSSKDLEFYLSLPYVVELRPIPAGDGGGFEACIPTLGRWSAVGDGEDPHEAIDNLKEVLPSLFEDWLNNGVAIPEPREEVEELPSGVLSLRIGRSLHHQVIQSAKQDGVSINAYISNVLSQAVAARSSIDFVHELAERRADECKVFRTRKERDDEDYEFAAPGIGTGSSRWKPQSQSDRRAA